MTREPRDPRLSPERFTTFVDAVVAIAMTLLILPLMEAVSDAADSALSTAEFFAAHRGQLISFTVSFVLIASFWMEHHRVYRRVRLITTALIWINVAWLFLIVWLPVATAMIGQMPFDPLQAVVYIGSLLASPLVTLAAKAYLLRHPPLHDHPAGALGSGMAGDTASVVLFLAALALALWVPHVGYAGLLLAAFTGPVARLIEKRGRAAR